MMRHMGNRLDRHTGGDAAHHRNVHRIDTGDVQRRSGTRWRRVRPVAGDDLGLEPGAFHRLGQLDDFQRAGAVGQPADKSTLFQRGDQTVDARLGFQLQRILHFVKRRRHAVDLDPLTDEVKQFQLFACQHTGHPEPTCSTPAVKC